MLSVKMLSLALISTQMKICFPGELMELSLIFKYQFNSFSLKNSWRDKIRKMVKTHIRRSVFMKQIKPNTRANSKFIVETLLTVQFNPGLRLICVWETGPQKFMHWCGRVEQTGSFPVRFLDKQFLMSCFREHTSNMYSWHTLLAANTLKGNQCWFHWDRGIGGVGVLGKFKCKHFFAGSFQIFFLLRRWFILSAKRTEAMYRNSLKLALT